MKRVIAFFIALGCTALPYVASAQVTLTNPLGESDPRVLIARIISGALSVTGSIALLMFVYGGLIWLVSMGKPDMIKKGKDILIWSVLGIIAITLAYVATDAIFKAVLTGNVAEQVET